MKLNSVFSTSSRLGFRFALVPTLALLLSVATPVFAQLGKYIPAGRPDGIALLAPPPMPGAPDYAADLQSAREVFKARTADEEVRCFKLAKLTIFNFEPAIGPFFQSNKLPKTQALFENLKPDVRQAIDMPKNLWKRQRPYQVDSKLLVGKLEPSFSYPSGHSTWGTVQSLILAEIFPEKREAILQIGRDIGWARVMIGKHFPTDVHAGRVLAQAIFRELMASPEFQRELAEVKAEVKAVQAEALATAEKN